MTTTLQARDLKEGTRLNLWRRGAPRRLAVKRVWVLTKSVLVDYDDGTSDLFRPWDDLTQQVEVRGCSHNVLTGQ
jgi:hypothetical protein